ncbi:hypothetical protein TWF718_010441 [Orbilia javanica]|uniref:Uncharacterized protein n=1 Tax=Orbilia javanica TaxID=47235 RepID=A0AAN8MP98_9PEZI
MDVGMDAGADIHFDQGLGLSLGLSPTPDRQNCESCSSLAMPEFARRGSNLMSGASLEPGQNNFRPDALPWGQITPFVDAQNFNIADYQSEPDEGSAGPRDANLTPQRPFSQSYHQALGQSIRQPFPNPPSTPYSPPGADTSWRPQLQPPQQHQVLQDQFTQGHCMAIFSLTSSNFNPGF